MIGQSKVTIRDIVIKETNASHYSDPRVAGKSHSHLSFILLIFVSPQNKQESGIGWSKEEEEGMREKLRGENWQSYFKIRSFLYFLHSFAFADVRALRYYFLLHFLWLRRQLSFERSTRDFSIALQLLLLSFSYPGSLFYRLSITHRNFHFLLRGLRKIRKRRHYKI